ncbi:hypothetical protein [Burkholderia cenocepacia]|uniref:hypothetical protein n=1 Tax=Burkholderia cenocepacia TaxID=95486 RepID=UPI000770DE72|nr:hypothetical protein [Burkholderia cenocepacia]KVF54712.1 hypothetical protein WJ14_21330 [Burkholderia cenocepacia]
MENVSTSMTTPPSDKKKSLIDRLKKINRLFAITVLAPTAIAVVYFGLVASDVYVSESRFVVRGAQRQTQTSVVGALLQGTGFSRAQDDTYPVIDYIESRDALRELNQSDYIANTFSQNGDFVSRFHKYFDSSFEGLWKYYTSHIVSVDFDATSAIATLQIRAYTAQDAAKINERLLDISERLINRMNARAATDTVQFAQHEVELATKQAKDAAAALATYRNSHTVFDPDRQSALQLQQVTSLQTQLFAAQTRLIQLQSISPQNPQIPALQSSIDAIQKQIKIATGDVTGGQNSLSQKAAGYARLQLDAQFADKQLASALGALENARAEAERQQLYLERLVQPNVPDKAQEPRRVKRIIEVFALGMLAWGILSLLFAGIREHSD